jgi:hypothetical protein
MSTGPITNLLAPKSDPGLLISDAGGRTWWWSSRPLDINKQSSVDEISAKIRGMAISPLSCKDRNNLLAESNSCTDEEIDFQIFADNRFFVEALYFVLRFEGGYIQHPGDPISTTNKGIPQKRYDEWRSAKGLSARDVKEIDDSEVVQIYFEGYWLPPHCGSLPPSLGILLFDTAVNMGWTPAVKFMATELGLDPDAFATQVRAAVAESGQTNVAARYIDAREARYRQLVARRPQLGAFMKGWLARLDTLARSIGVDRPDTM